MKISKYFLSMLWFFIGALISYMLSQFSYFNVNTEINIVETIIAAISIIIGLYIAITIQKRYNRNQNLYTYLVGRLDSIWSDFNAFSNQVDATDQIELNRVNKVLKDLQKRNSDLNNLLIQLGSINNQFETLSEILRKTFEGSLIKDNIVYYDANKETISGINKSITDNLADIFNQINNKV